jgi:dienelactone hydrolase
LFRPPVPFTGRRAAVIFLHGGPARQMLLGWHHRGYYHRAYGFNQYLASQGYCVLSVNFRLGTGYGRAFREVADGGPRGAAEYLDLLAGHAWLAHQEFVDPQRIGLWGGSYGGLLTAMGLARNSDLFAAGVDFHGVHDWNLWQAWVGKQTVKANDATAHRSSPRAALETWRSPVLLVHGDDDRNVPFAETIWLARELTARRVDHEVLVLPGETHSFLRHSSWLQAFTAAAGFLDRKLRDKATPQVAIRSGAWRYEFDLGRETLEVFTYKPDSYRGERMILVLHGTLRNADEYRDHARSMGERFGALIIAPRFDAARFPPRRYHRGGILRADRSAAPADEWTYGMIPRLARAIRTMEGRPQLPLWIIGHSAGGQFVARMSAFQATGAVRHVAANPGTQLFPQRDMPFPYGLGDLPRELADSAALRRYLAAPLTIYLGTADDKPDRYLSTSRVAMRQGPGRLQRGHHCFAVAKDLAERHGWPFNWRLVEALEVGHDHRKMFDHARCEDALFGK